MEKENKKFKALDKFYYSIIRVLRNNGRNNYIKRKEIQDCIDEYLDDLAKKEKEVDENVKDE